MRNTSGVLLTRFAAEVAMSLSTALIGAIVCYGSLEFGTGWDDAGPQPGYFPFYISVIIMLASGVNLVNAAIHRAYREEVFLTTEQGRRVLLFFGPVVAFVCLASFLGLYVALILYLGGVMVFQGGYGLPKAAVVSILTAIVCYLLFEAWFEVPLLKGPVEAFIGMK